MEVICSSGPTLEELQIIHASLSQSLATPAFVTDGGITNSDATTDQKKPAQNFGSIPTAPQANSTGPQNDTKQ